MRNTPWYHQRRSESAPPAERAREPPTVTLKEQDESVSRLLRPTESARYRKSLFWKLDGYMDKGFHSWSKMELFEDSKQCMWTGRGTIKNSCKIRPLNKILPPLRSGGRDSQSSADVHGNMSCQPTARSCIESMNSGSVCTSQDTRCGSRRAVLRPRPSMERSRTNISAKQCRIPSHPSAGRSFFLHGLRSGGGQAQFGSPGVSSLAVPRMNAPSMPQTSLVGN